MFSQTKYRLKSITIYALIPFVIFSCTKDEVSCGADITISNYYVVNEGEDLIFTVEGLDNTGIDYFLWECADMKPYNSLNEGRVYEGDPEFIIQDFNVQDIGKYSVKMYPKGESCAPVILEKTVTMNPKNCPCATPALENTLYYSNGYSNETMTATIYNSNTEESSEITFNGTNTFTIFFGRKLPEVSSTFNLVDGNNTFWDENDDAFLDVHFHFDAWNHGFDYFGLDGMTDGFYLDRDQNILTMQFCDVQLHNYITQQFTISGKFVVVL